MTEQKTPKRVISWLKTTGEFNCFIQEATALIETTKSCRASMHEPDEAGVNAFPIGGTFDNAGVSGEQGLWIFTTEGEGKFFNMASLVAMARIGALAILKEQ